MTTEVFAEETLNRRPFEVHLDASGPVASLRLAGSLTAMVPADSWRPLEILKERRPPEAVFDLASLAWIDLSGLAQLREWRDRLGGLGIRVAVINIPANLSRIYNLAEEALSGARPLAREQPGGLVEEVGRGAVSGGRDLKAMISFLGDLGWKLAATLRHPGRFRLRAALSRAESAGINALPIVALVSFLVGLILAFQAAMAMRMFGAEIFVSDLIAIAVSRELGPLMTAIVLAGRSGSAFAAELGAMKASQEIDALTTMGLDPVRFLVVGWVAAVVAVTPILTLMADFVGLLGGSLVLLGLGYPSQLYWDRAFAAIDLVDVLGGLFKAGIFGFIVAGVGCQRGLAVAGGPETVGRAATKSVVTNIVLIAVCDSVFAILFYVLGI